MTINWKSWLAVWIGTALLGAGASYLLLEQGLDVGASITYVLFGLFDTGWLIYGFVKWWHVPWVKRIGLVVVSTWIAGLLSWFLLSSGAIGGAYAIVGIWAMGVAFFVGLQLVRFLLSFGHPIFGVARTVVDEAMRMKLPLIFVVILVVLVPVLPFAMDAEDQLRYRIQTFLTWSMFAVSGLLSLMTVFLAVGTITSEIQKRQIFLSMSKPVSRPHYLAGKWLGIAALDGLLVAVCGIAIYVFTMMLAQQPAKSVQDAIAVSQRVLVARASEAPRPPGDLDFEKLYQQRLDLLRAEDPARYGNPGDPYHHVHPAMKHELQQAVMTRWYSIGPSRTQTYLFTDLGPAKEYGQTVQLRIKPKAGSSALEGKVYLNGRINGRPFPIPPLADNTYHVVDIPVSLIDLKGQLEVAFTNAAVDGRNQPSISFNLDDGIEVFYKVGTFEGNLARSLGLLWLRLSFLAMLGLAAGTFLGFPVACLVCLMVYVAAAGSAYLGESLEFYTAFPSDKLPLWERIIGVPVLIWDKIVAGEVWDGFKIIIRVVGGGFMLLVPKFGQYNPTPLLTEGRDVSFGLLGGGVLWLGAVWTGAAAVIGYLIFRSRELARVTV